MKHKVIIVGVFATNGHNWAMNIFEYSNGSFTIYHLN